jgi:hypothetical protein
MKEDQKYSPLMLHGYVAGQFYLKEKIKGKMAPGGEIPIHEFRIFVQILDNEKRCYLIASVEGQTHLYEGACTGTRWREQKQSVLSENKERLGEVIIERNSVIIKKYRTYDEFWNDIRE